jgi:aspartyl-tRNA(Asn)/glutamyl-tRNA(Gln) amidotransferase subunit C
MTDLTTDNINKVAHLAKLTVPAKENAALLEEINKILKLVDTMSTVDTNQVEPLAHPYDEKQPLRADVVTEKNQRELFQSIAPLTEAGLYIVPPVIDNE